MLQPHVYAVADQAWRMLVSEKKHQSFVVWSSAGKTESCCAIVEYNPAGWGALASRPNTGPDYPFNINRRAHVRRHSPLQHYSHSLSTSLCAHSHSCCFIICASICTRLHTRCASDLRALLSCRCRFGMKAASPWCESSGG